MKYEAVRNQKIESAKLQKQAILAKEKREIKKELKRADQVEKDAVNDHIEVPESHEAVETTPVEEPTVEDNNEVSEPAAEEAVPVQEEEPIQESVHEEEPTQESEPENAGPEETEQTFEEPTQVEAPVSEPVTEGQSEQPEAESTPEESEQAPEEEAEPASEENEVPE